MSSRRSPSPTPARSGDRAAARPETLAKVVAAVTNAGRVDIYGFGASAFVAPDLQQKLHRIRRVGYAWSDVHIMLTSAALLGQGRRGDRHLAHRHHHGGGGGAGEASRHGATTVALTNFPRSPLARTADQVLTTAARETTYRSGATSSRIAQLMVVDCLFIGVAQQVLPDARKALETTYSAVRGTTSSRRSTSNRIDRVEVGK